MRWLEIIYFAGGFFVLFGLAEFLYHKIGIRGELTRKLVHTGSGLIALLFPVFLNGWREVGLLCLAFLFLLLSSWQLKILLSINDVFRTTWGSVLFPVVVFICFVVSDQVSNHIFYYLPLLILAIADPMAALIGKRTQWKSFRVFRQQKSLGGCFTFFLVSLILGFGILSMYGILSAAYVPGIIGVALASSLAEALSSHGFDNLTVPSVIMIVMYFCEF